MAGRSIDAASLPWSPQRGNQNVWIKTLETRYSHPGISFHVLKLAVGAEMAEHTHQKETETLYITSGRGILTMGAQQVACREGVCASVPPGTPRTLRNAGDTPLELIAVYSPPLV